MLTFVHQLEAALTNTLVGNNDYIHMRMSGCHNFEIQSITIFLVSGRSKGVTLEKGYGCSTDIQG